MAEPTPRILIIRRRYLGDIVLLGSVLRNLRLHWPGASLSVVVERRFEDVVAMNPDVNAVLALPGKLGEWPAFLRKVRAGRFTHVLDIDNTEKTALIARLSGASTRVALHHGEHPLKFRFAYTTVVYDPQERHENSPITDYYLRSLEPLQVPVTTRDIRLEAPAVWTQELRRYLGASRRILLIHPGSRSPMRVWPAERFAAVTDYVQDELDTQVILIGGPADESTLADIRQRVRTHLYPLPGAMPIGRLAALAHLSQAMLCHDSGPMHVAAAVGTPVIAIYGSQNAALFRPMGEAHTILRPPLPCTTCVAPGRCKPEDSYHNRCVQNVTLDAVKAAVRQTLRRN